MRTRRRRQRGGLLALVVLLVAAIGIVVPLTASHDHELAVETPSGHPTHGGYVPHTITSHGVTQMAITLPDGRPFTVRYASDLGLANLGFQSTVAATLSLGGSPNTQTRTLAISHSTIGEHYAGRAPTATYADANGKPVPYYRDIGLVVPIGPWLVVVPDLDDPANHPDEHLTPDQLTVWAQNLSGWVDDSGFPVVAPGRALQLNETAKSAFVLGPAFSSKDNVGVGERWLCEGPDADTTTPRRFPPTPRGAAKGAAWCDKATGLHVTVVGTQRFVNGVVDSFRIAPFSSKRRATKIVLEKNTVEAGASIPGVVVVVNNTGNPLQYGDNCGPPFEVVLTRKGAPPSPDGNLLCLMTASVPKGESTFDLVVGTQSLTPGKYQATMVPKGDLPTPKPVRVRVVAAR